MTQHAMKEQAGCAPAERFSNLTVNVNEVERVASAALGGAMALVGVSRGSLGGAALALVGAGLVYRGITGHCHLYDSFGIDTAVRHSSTAVPAQQGVRVEKSITIQRPADEVYRFWRDFENLAQFMRHLESVKTDGNVSHWVAKAPLGMTVEWDAEIINERENELIAWRSLEGSEVDTAGSVHFNNRTDGRGCEIVVNLKYNPPGGKIGAAVAGLLGENPERQISEDLRRLKQILEGDEIPAAESQPSARRAK